MRRIIVSFTRVYRVRVWCGFVRFALLLAGVLCWVARFGSWVLLGLFCLLCVTRAGRGVEGAARGQEKVGSDEG